VPGNRKVLARRVLTDRRIELTADPSLTRGVVYVHRRTPDVKITQRDLRLVLNKAGVKVTDDVLTRVSRCVEAVNAGTQTDTEHVVAEGIRATAGRDARLQWAVEPNARYRHRTDENGATDFRDLEDNGNVRQGQLLLTVIPATHGTAGVDIFGDVIRPRPGRDADLRRGRNVTLSDDGTLFHARANGRLSFHHNVVSVETVYEVRGSVDYAVGNIEFWGPVIVHGDVKADFTVRSEQWIEVRGTVEGAHLFARDDVHVRGGINGRGKCRIECGGSLTARYLNGVNADVGADVKVVKSVVHSEVRCGGGFRVITQGVRASRITAGGSVDVPVVGSERAVPTEISAGVDVVRQRRLQKLAEAADELTGKRQKLRQALGGLVREPARIVEVRPIERRARQAQMLREYFALERELEELALGRREAETEARQASECTIRIARMVWRGVTLRITDVEHVMHRSRRGPVEYVAARRNLVAT